MSGTLIVMDSVQENNQLYELFLHQLQVVLNETTLCFLIFSGNEMLHPLVVLRPGVLQRGVNKRLVRFHIFQYGGVIHLLL